MATDTATIIIKPGEPDYKPGFGCQFCYSDQKPVAISSFLLEKNRRAFIGDGLYLGTCGDCARKVSGMLAELRLVHIKCLVNACTNRTDEGEFVGDLCAPCHTFIANGRGVHSQAFRNALEAAKVVMSKVARLEHVHGALQNDRDEIFPAAPTI